MDFIRKNARYIFAVNAYESFVVSCFVFNAVLAFFFYEIGILPATIINILSLIFFAVCFCLKGGREDIGIQLFYIEVAIFSVVMTTLFSAGCGFILYCTPFPFTSYMEINDRGKRRLIFISSILLMLLEIPLSILGGHIFGDYRLMIEPYREVLLLVNFGIVVLSNLYVVSYIAEKDKAISETQYKSEHDVLTDAYNRTFFSRYIKNLASQGPISGALIMFDIDNFKKINDKFGHDIGDIALKMVTKVAKSLVRTEDVLVRWGGEEFIIFIRGMELDKAAEKAEEIRSAIAETPFYEDNCLTVTLGVTEAQSDEFFEIALKRVDDNLYAGKTSGKNKVVAE
ncbi:MAG: GGDEF domain-containing protein [Lachnospiraceae bacterium]|nr:GGDEF domain-containing protein [Lachnospiraceae bacterium]